MSGSDDEILRRFMKAPFPEEARSDLAAYVEVTGYPLAVRSSSLLEDALEHHPDVLDVAVVEASGEVRVAGALDDEVPFEGPLPDGAVAPDDGDVLEIRAEEFECGGGDEELGVPWMQDE